MHDRRMATAMLSLDGVGITPERAHAHDGVTAPTSGSYLDKTETRRQLTALTKILGMGDVRLTPGRYLARGIGRDCVDLFGADARYIKLSENDVAQALQPGDGVFDYLHAWRQVMALVHKAARLSCKKHEAAVLDRAFVTHNLVMALHHEALRRDTRVWSCTVCEAGYITACPIVGIPDTYGVKCDNCNAGLQEVGAEKRAYWTSAQVAEVLAQADRVAAPPSAITTVHLDDNSKMTLTRTLLFDGQESPGGRTKLSTVNTLAATVVFLPSNSTCDLRMLPFLRSHPVKSTHTVRLV